MCTASGNRGCQPALLVQRDYHGNQLRREPYADPQEKFGGDLTTGYVAEHVLVDLPDVVGTSSVGTK